MLAVERTGVNDLLAGLGSFEHDGDVCRDGLPSEKELLNVTWRFTAFGLAFGLVMFDPRDLDFLAWYMSFDFTLS